MKLVTLCIPGTPTQVSGKTAVYGECWGTATDRIVSFVIVEYMISSRLWPSYVWKTAPEYILYVIEIDKMAATIMVLGFFIAAVATGK